MQRNNLDNRQQKLWGGWNKEYVVRDTGDFAVALAGHGHQASTARLYFPHHIQRAAVTQHRVGIVTIAGCQHHDRELLIHQRVGTMLQFPRRIAFRMRIRNLFQLQRTLARNGVMNPASEIKKLFCLELPLRELRGQLVPGAETAINGFG